MEPVSPSAEVFSASEIARAAGADVEDVRALIASGRVRSIDGRFVSATHAIDVVRSLRGGLVLPTTVPDLFQYGRADTREARVPLVGSTLAHAVMLGGLVLIVGMGSARPEPVARFDRTELVFLTTPGPGGGGGGGGLKQPAPPPRAEMKGASRMRSPVPTLKTVKGPRTEPQPEPAPVPAPKPEPVEPPPPQQEPEPEPPVVAPVATVAADERDRAGLPSDTASEADSRGKGTEGGAGTGAGTGLGEGDGSGIGPGSGGGTGGGPYRPGSGITPPSLLREVKPDYTEEARQRGINGEVELEIVVRRDGSVGDVRLQRGLGAGLDQRAIDAVRQWRFSPARRMGTPVDVLVEVAVAFKLR
jgi:protein TonB